LTKNAQPFGKNVRKPQGGFFYSHSPFTNISLQDRIHQQTAAKHQYLQNMTKVFFWHNIQITKIQCYDTYDWVTERAFSLHDAAIPNGSPIGIWHKLDKL